MPYCHILLQGGPPLQMTVVCAELQHQLRWYNELVAQLRSIMTLGH